ncbi:MAG: Eco57I restriction-modification methylase domain-containing protein [Deltaproteobacteria bacterium]|nr:Eco57I restriction-modification methylase domain-containing protein [Deltaproteobacteria bacterium]
MNITERLISECSIKNLQGFFINKIASFKPRTEDYQWLFQEKHKISEYCDNIKKIGEAELEDNEDLIVIAVQMLCDLSERSSKKKQFEIAKNILKEEKKDSSFFIFYDNNKNFRFSFISVKYKDAKREWTSFKRFTYFVSKEGKTNKTFKEQVGKCNFKSILSILEAFKVEPLNKEFYKEINNAFYHLVGEKNNAPLLKLPSVNIQTDQKTCRKFAVRLIGRIIFIWFLKKKKSPAGIPLIPKNWLIPRQVKNTPLYYHNFLEKLFFEILNKKTEDRNNTWLDKDHKKVPFLNGGLFQPQKNDYYKVAATEIKGESKYINSLTIKDSWFFNLFETLERFNFTIDENSLNDMEISVDPEMLGTIFENLLAEIDPDTEKSARKSTGSFYTPREIVDYMAEESLIGYLNKRTGIKEKRLRLFFKEQEDKKEDIGKDADAILDALDKIKILDPACGSGAFPMGMLHKITIILENIDPESEKWKEKQLNRITDPLLRREIEKKLDNATVEYIRKLGIVRNSIFGADIQTIATEISKLRCFLTLIAEEQINDKDEDNRGVEALPNLELKFIAANTLIGLESVKKKKREQKLDFAQTADDIQKLKNISEKYLTAYGDEKERFKKEFSDLHSAIIDKEIENAARTGKVSNIMDWKPFENKKVNWFDSEFMFGVKEFDIVIGNPPYIQLQKVCKDEEKYADLYKEQKYKTFTRRGDIYALFYEKGINLLNENGHLCYVTSNKWMRAKYGEKLRKFFALKNPLKLIDLGPGAFDTPTVDTNILLIRNEQTEKKSLKAAALKNKEKITDIKDNFITLSDIDEKIWTISTPQEQKIKEKIEKIGTPLKKWDININYGIKTGYNKAFIIDDKTKNKLIAEDGKSKEIIKPVLRGRDIKRYKAEFAGLWLINTHNGYKYYKNDKDTLYKQYSAIKIDDYPAIKKHLKTYYDKLKKRQDKGKTPYNLRSCAYYQEFEKEKIIYNDISQKLSFALCEKGIYFNNTVYFITSSKFNNYLIAALNAKLINWYYRMISAQLGGKAVRLFSIYVNNIPIPQIPKAAQKPFEELVDKIILKKEAGENTEQEEKLIDIMVYKLYQLSYKEVKIVNPEFDLTEKEYES